LRALYESRRCDIQIVAINDLADAQTHAHLTTFDSTHGRFSGSVTAQENFMTVNGDHIRVLSELNPAFLPWHDLDVDVVLECTGRFPSHEAASAHLAAGAKRVIISAPAGSEVATLVLGVNDEVISGDHRIIAIGSCTTNCLAVVARPLHSSVGIEAGTVTTVHAVTNDQVLLDMRHADLRRARSALASIIPTKTGAAAAIGQVIPDLEGRLDGHSIRVPTLDVCLLVLSFSTKRRTSAEEINGIMREASIVGPLSGVLKFNDLPLVSTDFLHNDASAIFDSTLTRVIGGMHATIYAWYDNEWGFANRLLDSVAAIGRAASGAGCSQDPVVQVRA